MMVFIRNFPTIISNTISSFKSLLTNKHLLNTFCAGYCGDTECTSYRFLHLISSQYSEDKVWKKWVCVHIKWPLSPVTPKFSVVVCGGGVGGGCGKGQGQEKGTKILTSFLYFRIWKNKLTHDIYGQGETVLFKFTFNWRVIAFTVLCWFPRNISVNQT